MNSRIISSPKKDEKFSSRNAKKFFKEDDLFPLKEEKIRKISSNPIKNFVPVLKPKKAFIRPPPLQLNPKNEESKNISFDKDILSSSSTEEENNIENINNFSTNEESPIFKFKEEKSETSF